MKKVAPFALIVLCLAAAFYTGYQFKSRENVTAEAPAAPLASPAGAEPIAEGMPGPSIPPPGTVEVSPEKQQLMGLKTAAAEKRPGVWTLRLLGRVAVDENRLYFINSTIDGWITGVRPITTGTFVKKDQILGSFYSPEFLSAEQALLFAMANMDRHRTTGKESEAQKDQFAQFSINLQQYKDTLRNLGMGDRQIEEMISKRKYMEKIHITSPADGFVTSRKISMGLRFTKGEELFRIADLSSVWVLTDTYESEAQYLPPGTVVSVSLPRLGKTFKARVNQTLPQFDAATRTLKVRMEVSNPGFVLKPDMFVDVEIPVSYGPAITVPADSVLDSGFANTLYVDRGDGLFEPRAVELGRRFGDRVEIVKGLDEGERYVIAGNFLLDSESRMKLAASGVYGTLARDPVSGADVSVRKADREGRKSIHAGKTYYFSSMDCKRRFDSEPARYTGQLQDERPAAVGASAPAGPGR